MDIPGLSNNVADLVSQTFSQKRGEKRHNARQDSGSVGGGAGATALDQSMISGMLKLLGFDGAKIGAAAVNGEFAHPYHSFKLFYSNLQCRNWKSG